MLSLCVFLENAWRRLDQVPPLPEAGQLRLPPGRVRASVGRGQKPGGVAGHPQRGAGRGSVAAGPVHGG